MATTLAENIFRDSDPIVLAGDGLPAGTFAVEVDAEVMKITTRPDNPLFVDRGANGSEATSHSAGASVTPLFVSLTSTPGGGV